MMCCSPIVFLRSLLKPELDECDDARALLVPAARGASGASNAARAERRGVGGAASRQIDAPSDSVRFEANARRAWRHLEPPGLSAVLEQLAPPSAQRCLELRASTAVRPPQYHAVVVLGVPTPDTGPIATSLQNRIDKAFTILTQDVNAVVIATGAAVKSNVVEADVIAWALMQRGIDWGRIETDRLALTTPENSKNVLRMLCHKLRGAPCTISLVTEPYQAVRAMRSFVVACERSEFSKDFVVQLALTEALPLEQSAEYPWPGASRIKVRPPSRSLLDVCSVQGYGNLTRCIAEKYKLMAGY